MKILITTDLYLPAVNGVVTSVCNLKREMEERGHEVRILTLSGTGSSYIKNQVYYIKSIRADRIYPGARVSFLHKDQLVKELIQWKPDMIHSQCEFTTFAYAIRMGKRCGCPVLHTYHTIYEDYTHYFSPSKALGKKLARSLTKRLLRKTDGVIAPTKKVEELLRSYEVEAPIHVIATGIDLQKYSRRLPMQEKEALRKRWGISRNQRILVSVGRLAKEKNVEELLDFIHCKKERDLTLVLVGDGPHREALEEMADRLGIREQVIFTGMIPSELVWQYYQLGEVFVSASNSETQGLTYMEALASGTPALCRQDPCLEHILINGYNGYQYTSREDFFSHLEKMLSLTAFHQAMEENARESVLEFSNWAFGDAVERLYRKELARVSDQYEIKSRFGERAWSALRSR